MELIVISSAGSLALVATQLVSYFWLPEPVHRDEAPAATGPRDRVATC